MNKGRPGKHSRMMRGIAMLLVTVMLCSVSFLHVSASEEETGSVATSESTDAKATQKNADSKTDADQKTEASGTNVQADTGNTDVSAEKQKEDTPGAGENANAKTDGDDKSADTPSANSTDDVNTTEDEADNSTASPVKVRLAKAADTNIAPEHHKYIKKNGEDDYTLTLNVKGMFDSETTQPKVDVLLIVDKSGSMAWDMDGKTIHWGSNKESRMDILKSIVTDEGGLSDAILSNDQIDGRMAVVTYSGGDSTRWNPYRDASTPLSWTNDKNSVDTAIDVIDAKGGTNCEAGLREGAEALKSARSDAKKIVIFLSDGVPGYYYNSNGATAGSGNDYNSTAAQHAYTQAEKITGLDAFYTVGISNSTDNTFMTTLAGKPTADVKKYLPSSNKDELISVFNQIIAEVTEYTCRDVTITDTLSEYVELKDASNINPTITVTDAEGKTVEKVTVTDTNGEEKEISVSDLITVSFDSATKRVTAKFKDGYALDKNYTYSVSFNVKPTQKAYDEFAKNGYGDTVGSENSDAPDNDTSSGKPGFYSNKTAELTYTYGKEGAQSNTVEYAEKPVVQVSTLTIPVEKVWENTDTSEMLEEVTINLYQDSEKKVYKTLTLKADNDTSKNWKGSFTNVAKGHDYRVEETEVKGFVSEVKANASNDVTQGFTVTNTKLPELTITKEVGGKMGDKTKEFTFEISLKDKDGKPISGEFSYKGISTVDGVEAPEGGTLTFSSEGENAGKATVNLKHGQGITLTGLPLDSTYTVEETNSGKYTVTYTVDEEALGKDATQATGTLNEDCDVKVTNTLDPVPVTGIVTKTPWIGMLTALLLILAAAEGWLLLRRRKR